MNNREDFVLQPVYRSVRIKKQREKKSGEIKKTVEEKMAIVLLCSTKDGDIHLIYQSVVGYILNQ